METEARRRADARIRERSEQINIRLYRDVDDDAAVLAALDAARGAESRAAWVKRLVVDELLGDRQLVPRHGAVIMRKSE